MLGFLILYCKGMRPMMFQLSGFYCKCGFCFSFIGCNEHGLIVLAVPSLAIYLEAPYRWVVLLPKYSHKTPFTLEL